MLEYEHRLAAVLNDPGNDLPRLVMADSLEDSGEPGNVLYAEFVRTQIAIAVFYRWAETQFLVLPESRRGLQLERLKARERELWPQIFWQVHEHLGRGPAIYVPEVEVTRGLISAIELPRSALHHMPAILARCPIERVTVEGVEFRITHEPLRVDGIDWQSIVNGNRWIVKYDREEWVALAREEIVAGLVPWIESVMPHEATRFGFDYYVRHVRE